ncbi:MAG: leukotriene-A4 hydrolase, partial [Lentisphaeria bacterium]
MKPIAFTAMIIAALGLLGCSQQPSVANLEELRPEKDYHSFANTNEVRISHINMDLTVDFEQRQLRGFAALTLNKVTANANKVVLDTRDLSIQKVEALQNDKWINTDYHLGKADHALGSALTISLPPDALEVKVHYHTSPDSTGLQWLAPAQTSGKKQPFLFSQAQAIHARSIFPLQDTPQVRVTYEAILRTPANLRAVMSAENKPESERNGVYHFNMPQAIPSYLIALAVGDLQFKSIGARTGVYAEPEILEAAAAEFADTEAMLEVTEAAFGPYSWGRYDLLILPPSFPFGGMENPRLSFITPTVIAGDKSLVSLIAHELAHSWSGNSVTNATWRDFWLNEGFTTYLTYRIMEIVYGEKRFHMETVLGYQSLKSTLTEFPKHDQLLAIDLRGRDPDDAFSDIPYEKGSLLLSEIEQQVGRPAFDAFLKDYFKAYAFKSINTEEFLDFLNQNLLTKHPKTTSMKRIHQWVYSPGLPPGAPKPSSTAFSTIDETRTLWLSGKRNIDTIDSKAWTVHEWLYFLNNMPTKMSLSQLRELDNTFKLTTSHNNEIVHSWLLIAINNKHQPAFKRLETYLASIGRRKLIVPLYTALMNSREGSEFARHVYRKA